MAESKPVVIALVVVGLILLGVAGYSFLGSEDAPPPAPVEVPVAIPPTPVPEPEPAPPEPVSEPVPDPVAAAPVVPVAPVEPAFVLPRLDASDQLMRDGVASLTDHAGINRWLVPDELVRRFVVVAENVSRGGLPRAQIAMLAPEDAFSATRVSEAVYVLDTASYRRYDLPTEIFLSLDSRRAVEFYSLLRPLFQEAYDELGLPGESFDDVVLRAIAQLQETPVINTPVKLRRPVVMYEFDDPRLENLPAAQKQLVRMGPENTRKIQAKLAELALELRTLVNAPR